MNKHSLARSLLIFTFIFISAGGLKAQTPAQTPTKWKLSRIDFTGLQHCTRDRAIAASGLWIGEVVEVSAFETAVNRLAQSGYFLQARYKYLYTADQAELTFEVEEAKWLPVVFDNFVWFAGDELIAAVRIEEPSFDGTAPPSGEMLNSIKRSLEKLTDQKKIPGQIEYTLNYSRRSEPIEHVFRVAGVKVPVCGLRFPNANAIQESELLKLSKPILANEYSSVFAKDFAVSNLIPAYRERGYLKARFGAPQTKYEEGQDCKNGVRVALPVEEEQSYQWDRAEWSGNEVLLSKELDSLLSMRPTELANGLKIDNGIKAIHIAYSKRGYITAKLEISLSFDEQKKAVTYRVAVNEGPQYKMGFLMFTGVSESEAANLKSTWKLATGQVYDASYVQEFSDKVLERLRMRGLNVGFAIKPDRERLAVDVTISLRK